MRRRGSSLVIAWAAAAGAARYVVYVTGSDGERELFTTAAGKRRVKGRGVKQDDSATVSVEGARADGVTGRAAKLRVRPAGRRALAGGPARIP